MRTIDVGGNQGRGNPQAPARYPFAPGVVEGPDTDDDFLKQQTVFHGLWLVGRWALLVIAIACAAMAARGFFS